MGCMPAHFVKEDLQFIELFVYGRLDSVIGQLGMLVGLVDAELSPAAAAAAAAASSSSSSSGGGRNLNILSEQVSAKINAEFQLYLDRYVSSNLIPHLQTQLTAKLAAYILPATLAAASDPNEFAQLLTKITQESDTAPSTRSSAPTIPQWIVQATNCLSNTPLRPTVQRITDALALHTQGAAAAVSRLQITQRHAFSNCLCLLLTFLAVVFVFCCFVGFPRVSFLWPAQLHAEEHDLGCKLPRHATRLAHNHKRWFDTNMLAREAK
jgi:hypothetical protein